MRGCWRLMLRGMQSLRERTLRESCPQTQISGMITERVTFMAVFPRGIHDQIRGLAVALALALVLTLAFWATLGTLNTVNIVLFYLIPVVAGSTLGGLVPAIVVAAACVLAIDILFMTPFGALSVDNVQDGLT